MAQQGMGYSGWRRRHGEPQNRRQLFLCVLWDQFFSLMPINLLYMLFFLPAIAWTVACLLRFVSCAGAGLPQDAIGYLNSLFLGLIPCLALTGPARAGMALLMRNWGREDMTPPFQTFFRGLRENWKQALVVSFFTGLLPAALWYCYLTASQAGTLGGMSFFLIFTGIIFVLWLLSQQVLYTLIVTYQLPLWGHIRNALLLTLLKLPRALLIFVASLFPVLLYLGFCFLRPEMRYALLAIPCFYYFFFGGSITELIYASYANWLCDEYFGREGRCKKTEESR